MRRTWLTPVLSVCLCIPAVTQTKEPSPEEQTARQALIEMFLGKRPDDFAKHLPQETRRMLVRRGETP